MAVTDRHPAWEDGHPPHYPSLRGVAEADVCVIGLGGTGLTALLEAERLGLRATGLDAGAVAGGAAGRNGGFLLAGLPSFYHDAVEVLGRSRAQALYELTVEQIHRICGETPEAVRQVGSIRLATTPEEAVDCERQLAALRDDHLPAAAYHGSEGRGLLLPTDAAFNPLLRCRRLAGGLADRGTTLHEHSQVTGFGPGRVETRDGVVRAGVIIIATDGGLTRLVPALAGAVRPARLQMLATAPEPRIVAARPVYARFGMEYWQQLPGGEVALGGFRDLGGEAEWTTDTSPTEPIQSALERFLRQELGVQAAVTHRWAATVSFREQELPFLAEIDQGIWAMGGYNGTGNVVGALCGRAAMELAVHGRSEIGQLLGAERWEGEARGEKGGAGA